MSINHISSELGDTLRWAGQAPINMEHTHLNQPVRAHNKPLNFNLNQTNETSGGEGEDKEEMAEQTIYIQKESMFEKPLTPSDVGKLNRLVIPKQHAEKYFPLGGSDSVEKGLLLSFEDESGKTWRFRYSYWNSSQSYVLTKGWSRYVKEKRLDAGDVVVFERSREDCDRFFVGWRPRNAALPPQNTVAQSVGSGGGGGGWSRVYYSNYPYPSTVNSNGQQQPAVTYQPHSHHAPTSGGRSGVMQNQTTTVVGNSKTLRLFGVNLECQSDAAAAADDSNQGEHQASVHVSRQQSRRHMQQDINFSGDVNQMRFHQE